MVAASLGIPTEVHMIASLGAYPVIVQCIALIWGNETQVLRIGVGQTWIVLEVRWRRLKCWSQR